MPVFNVEQNADDRPLLLPSTLPRSRNYDHFDVQGERLVDQGPIKEKLKALVKGEPIDDSKDFD